MVLPPQYNPMEDLPGTCTQFVAEPALGHVQLRSFSEQASRPIGSIKHRMHTMRVRPNVQLFRKLTTDYTEVSCMRQPQVFCA
jgi:hypothetical protein